MQGTAERAELWVGAAVLVVAAGFLLHAVGGSQVFSAISRGYELRAAFPNVDGVEPGTDVRLAGVRVGKVSSVTLNRQTYMAEARLSLPADILLPRDSAALIQSDGLLGGAYIELQPGGAEENLAPGEEIEDVQGAVSLISLMMKFVDSQGSDSQDQDSQP